MSTRKRDLVHQFKYILAEAHHRGGSKRAAKFDGQMEHLIFGDLHYDELCRYSKLISGFMEKLGIKMLYDIKANDIKPYLDDRAKTCNAKTMIKEISYIRKLEKIAQYYYPRSNIEWGTENFKASDYVDIAMAAKYEKNKMLDTETIKKLIEAIDKNTTDVNIAKTERPISK